MKILTFSEYCIQNAIFIQQERKQAWYNHRKIEDVMISIYCDYLHICGVPDEIIESINDFKNKINPDFYSYDAEFHKNYRQHIDEIIEIPKCNP